MPGADVRPVMLITGGNSGIGLECARRLAREPLALVIASPDRERSARVVEELRRETGNPAVEEMGLDLGSLADVRRFAAALRERHPRLHGLVLNAGVQFRRGPLRSADGFERTFAVNHLGHFLLTQLLLEPLRAGAPARILVVSSGVHDPSRTTGMPDPWIPDLEAAARDGAPPGQPFSGPRAYVNSKLCNLWFAYELVRRIEAAGLQREGRPLSVNAFEPGLVPGTGLARDYPAPLRLVWRRVLPLLARFVSMVNRPETSGAALAELLLDPDLAAVSGRYFPSHTRFRAAPSSHESYDEARARELWELSLRLCRLTPGESPLL